MARNRIGIIGSGATALYTLKHLLTSQKMLEVTIFESNSQFGIGMPYNSSMNADYMLCNAFSREIPPITQSLLDWLQHLPKRELNEWELSFHDLSARAFYPRLLIGEFLEHEFLSLCKHAENAGHKIKLNSNEFVRDIIPSTGGTSAVTTDRTSGTYEFDHVVIASGHSWPLRPNLGNAELMSPWPFTKITELPPANIGILGSSLSAIDIVSVLGHSHGTFHDEGGTVSWHANENASNLRIVMLSKEGIMPEGDFYYPFPYEPLKIITEKAVDGEVAKGSTGLLHRVFKLLCEELDIDDPTYLEQLGSEARSIEGFSTAYFKRRQEIGGLGAVKKDFVQVRKSLRDRITIAHRYVLLRAHETFDRTLRNLNDSDWELFTKKLLPVFADCYAAVPHLSLARVIAMYDAGVIDLKASGNDASFYNGTNGSVNVEFDGRSLNFDKMIDARGQSAAPLDHLPFPSLVKELPNKMEHLTAPFKFQFSSLNSTSIYCLALPQMLERHPFSQGLPNCANNGEIVASNLLQNT